MGASNHNAGRNHPWSGTVLTTNPPPSYNTSLGSTQIIDPGKYKMSPAKSEYQLHPDFAAAPTSQKNNVFPWIPAPLEYPEPQLEYPEAWIF